MTPAITSTSAAAPSSTPRKAKAGPPPPGSPVRGVTRSRENASGVSAAPVERRCAATIADNSASAAGAAISGRSRAKLHSHEPSARLARGLSCGCIISGAQASNAIAVYSPRNAGGATPITVNGWPLTLTRRPIAPGSPPSRVRQNACETTSTGWVPGVRFSSGAKKRPSAGSTPSTSK